MTESELVLPEPWTDLRAGGSEEAAARERLLDEVLVEIAAGHPLFGRSLQVVARSSAQDDVLLHVDDHGWAIVHLTWRGQPEAPPWPTSRSFGSLSDLLQALGDMS